jgi:septum formation protein
LKCKNIANKYNNSVVIGADTIVFFKKKIYNKPKNKKDAIKQLNSLSNNTHIVYTGVSIISKIKKIDILFYDKTYVTFNKLQKTDIKHYINLYNPMDKSGSYGIQDWSAVFVKKINGCYNNVIGFPLSKFYKLSIENKLINHD